MKFDDDLMLAIANALSTITIVSSLFLKVPQIIYMREKQSAEGILIQAMIMEIVGFSVMTLYNYTNRYGLMTYMEYPIILIQVYIMFYYVLKYKNMLNLPIVHIASIAYLIITSGFALDLLPKIILSYAVPLCTPLSGFAKVTYMYGIIKAGNADAVSLTTWVISMGTNLARVFTVYVDSADGKLIANFLISTLLSSGVFFTAIYYKRKTASRGSSQQRRNSPVRRHSPDHED